MDVEGFIRDSAARGLSRTATAAALGMRFEKFRTLLEAMPALQWPAPGQSLDERRCREAMRGHCHPSHRANLAKAKVASRARHVKTVRGVSGTIPELIKHFGAPASHDTVLRRVRLGMTLEEALFMPPIPANARRRKQFAQPAPSPEPLRDALSVWERVDIEFAGGPAPMCM